VSILPGIYASQITGHLSTLAYDSIATITVGSTAQASITFTSIPSTYKHLQLRVMHLMGSTSAGSTLQVGNGSTDTGSNYKYHYLNGNGATASAGSGGTTSIGDYFTTGASATNIPLIQIWDILDYTNSNKYKTVRALTGVDNNGSGEIDLVSGLWMNTAAITNVTMNSTGNFTQYSSFALYGCK
jgi:hypothetical protein